MSEELKAATATQEKPVETTSQPSEAKQPKEEQVINQDGVLNKNRELLGKNKELQTKYQELEGKIKEMEEGKLKEKEEYKELSEKYKKELDELKPSLNKAEKYDEYFKAQLAKEMENVPDSAKAIINSMLEKGTPVDECLTHLASLKKDMGKTMLGVATERVGGSMPEIDIDKYRGPDGAEALLALSQDNPEMYKVVQNKINSTRR